MKSPTAAFERKFWTRKNISTEITELAKTMKSGKQKYLAIKNGTDCLCPTCEQHIQDSAKEKTIANMRKNLTDAFNRKNTLEAKEKDLKFKLTMEKCHYHALGGDTSIENNKRIANIKESIDKLELEQKEIEKFNNEISIKERNIQNAKRDISNFNKQIFLRHFSGKNVRTFIFAFYIYIYI